jgi:subtilisin-like proprotein convertase family protein
VHADGEIWSRALWDLNQDIGAAAADQLVLESHFMVPANSSMVQAAEMILQADANLNAGLYEANIRSAFEARGILEPPATIGNIALDGSVYAPGDTIQIQVSDGNAPNNIQVQVTSSSGDSETLTLNGNGIYSTTLTSADASVTAGDGVLQGGLGDSFTVSYTDADDGSGTSFTATDTAIFENVRVYTSADTPITITDNNTITSTISITDEGTLLDVDLQLDITHTWDADLTAVLTSPDGQQFTLFTEIGGNGDNFTNTIFDDDATNAIGSGTAPFTGTFRPEEAFAAMNGTSMAGDWVLSISDSATQDQGTLNTWSLFLVVEAEEVVAAPEIVINNAEVGRSVIDELVVEFDEIVNIESGAFELVRRGADGGAVGVTPVIDNSSGSTVVTLQFFGSFTGAAGLVDGNYQLTMIGDLITSQSGTAMDGDGDGAAGGNYVFGDTAADNFFRFFGDDDGDRDVDVFDLLGLRQTFGDSNGDSSFDAQFDSNGDGIVNVFDLLAFRQNFSESLDFV